MQASDAHSTSRILEAIVQMTFDANDFDMLGEYVILLTKRRGALKLVSDARRRHKRSAGGRENRTLYAHCLHTCCWRSLLFLSLWSYSQNVVNPSHATWFAPSSMFLHKYSTTHLPTNAFVRAAICRRSPRWSRRHVCASRRHLTWRRHSS